MALIEAAKNQYQSQDDRGKRKEKTKQRIGDRVLKTKTTYEPTEDGSIKVTKKTIDRPTYFSSSVSNLFGADRTRKKEIHYEDPNKETKEATKKEEPTENDSMAQSLKKSVETSVNSGEKKQTSEEQSKEEEKKAWEEKQNQLKSKAKKYVYKQVSSGQVEKVESN